METLIDYFSTIPPAHRSALIIGGITFFLLLETGIPYYIFKYKRWRHAGVNLFFTLTTVLVNLSMALILVWSSAWVIQEQFGVMQWLNFGIWPEFLIGLLLMDFIGAWLIHYVQHHVPVLWRFHLVHHTDMHLDVTSGNRHHPGESVFRFLFTCLAVVVVGAPIWLIMLYQALSVVMTQFNHANIKLPSKLEEILSYVLVTPTMHRVHHHYQLPYTDTNYGNIFSIWDRLCRTFSVLENNQIQFGLDTHPNPTETQNIGELLKAPFKRKFVTNQSPNTQR